MAILLSVYCLTYNHEKYIRSALDGFVNQKTNFRYEVFVHDDASTDRTAEIILEYASKYPDIIKPIIQTENQYSKGIKIALTYIIPRISGKYVAICEGDDYWCDPFKLQRQVDFLEKNTGYSACVHNTFKIDETKKILKKGRISNRKQDCDLCFEDIIKGASKEYHTSSIVMRKEYCFNRPHYFNIAKGYGDYPLGVYLTTNEKIRYLSDAMSVYRLYSTPTSWTSRNLTKGVAEIAHFENVCAFLEAVKKEIGKDKRVYIDKAITEHKIKIAELKGNYDIIKEEPYRALYKQKSFLYKLKYRIKQYFPWLYKILKRV